MQHPYVYFPSTSDGGEEAATTEEQEDGEAASAADEGAVTEDAAKPQEAGEHLDIEAMIAALHSDSNTPTSESIAINM